jgi:hypothetical protein
MPGRGTVGFLVPSSYYEYWSWTLDYTTAHYLYRLHTIHYRYTTTQYTVK